MELKLYSPHKYGDKTWFLIAGPLYNDDGFDRSCPDRPPGFWESWGNVFEEIRLGDQDLLNRVRQYQWGEHLCFDHITQIVHRDQFPKLDIFHQMDGDQYSGWEYFGTDPECWDILAHAEVVATRLGVPLILV